MNINLLLFLSMLGQAELYLSNSISKRTNRKQSPDSLSPKTITAKAKNITLDSQIKEAILGIKQEEKKAFPDPIKIEGVISKIISYATEAKEFVSEIKSNIKSFYGSAIRYAKSKYEEIRAKKPGLEGWQIGIEFSKYCNFVFFPRKIKKMTSYLMDLGALPDRIHASPVLCYF